MPVVSVIVPVYNAEKYLDECVKSLVNQTLQDIELILVDDGSSDRSGEICDGYAARYHFVKVIHQTNGGVGAARNRGLEEAAGEWVTFMDSDDWAEPDMVEIMLGHALVHSSDISIFGLILEDNSGKTKQYTFPGGEGYRLTPDDKIKLYGNNCLPILPNKPYKIGGNVLNQKGLIENLPADACVEVPCLVDGSGVSPCYVGKLPVQLAAMNMTHINVHLLTIEAARTKKHEHIYHAAMLEPHTAAELSIDDIRKMVDELIKAHGKWLPKYK